MKKNIVIVILAVVCLILAGYLGLMLTKNKMQVIKPETIKSLAESFINQNLLSPEITGSITEVAEENGLYKLFLSLSNGQNVNPYITKDGKLFFTEGLNIEEISKQQEQASQNNGNSSTNGNTSMDLQTEVLKEGSGEQTVQSGDSITVDYTGTLLDGTKFDSSIDRNQPFTFTIGQGAVIQGWEQGLLGMKVGEERKLTIPSDLAYGQTGQGAIPPNATLIFDVKLISIN